MGGVAVKECLAGSTSFNGQRCTAIKLIVLHESIADAFCERFTEAISGLPAGPPFGKNAITPLPEPDKPKYLRELIEDAEASGICVWAPGQGRAFWQQRQLNFRLVTTQPWFPAFSLHVVRALCVSFSHDAGSGGRRPHCAIAPIQIPRAEGGLAASATEGAVK